MNDYNGISEIRLTQPLFQQGCFIPSQINLIIGRNGTGKFPFAAYIKPLPNREEKK